MLDDISEKTPSKLGEVIATCNYELGITASFDEAADELLKRAGIAFINGNDSLASLLRETSRDLKKIYNEKRAEYDKDFRPLGDAAFELLEKFDK